MRCNTKYIGTVLTTLPASSYFACLDICDKNLACTGITWQQSSQVCTLFKTDNFYKARNYDYGPNHNKAFFFAGYSSALFNNDCPYGGS